MSTGVLPAYGIYMILSIEEVVFFLLYSLVPAKT